MLAILLLLFVMNGKVGDLKNTLSELIAFYRENREMIQLIAGNLRSTPSGEHAPETPPQEKSRPTSEVGNADILRAFLERRAV